MPRYKMTIEYDGGPFAGWQSQANALTVQDVMENAFFVLSGARPTVHAAGRTDAGVHARGQVAHVNLDRQWDTRVLRNAINAHLRPHPVSVLAVETVTEDFHARFSAIRRHYLYRIANRPAPLALERGKAWWHPVALDHAAMNEAAQAFVGKHDFTTFRAAECQAQSPVKTLEYIQVTRDGDMIDITVEARSFLHHQVRSMVGSLKLVGEGKWPIGEIKAALLARDRTRCGPVAPPTGLYLMRVDY
jgi:tRNA pseudouridine38-40 synthase